jgi:hypothetical protein
LDGIDIFYLGFKNNVHTFASTYLCLLPLRVCILTIRCRSPTHSSTHSHTHTHRYFQTLRLGTAGWLQLTAAFCIHFGFMAALYFYLEAASASSGGLSSLVQVCLDSLEELQSQPIVFQPI